jgi:hypothetical protein
MDVRCLWKCKDAQISLLHLIVEISSYRSQSSELNKTIVLRLKTNRHTIIALEIQANSSIDLS